MKTLLYILFATAYTAYAVPLLSETPENRELQRFVSFTDDEGVVHTIDLEAEPQKDILNEIARDAANNQYLLFTRRNPDTAVPLFKGNADSIRRSTFNPRVNTIVIVHGWLSSQDSSLNPTIRDAALGKDDVNVIVVDWKRLAVYDYITAVKGVPDIGRGLGQFIDFLSSVTGAPLSSFHLVGFSLGAHVVGNAGRELGGKIARITALDPAGPLWNLNNNRVSPDDAVYVEAIHTDGDTFEGLGIGSDVADADFYVNGGTSQPGCISSVCNHNNAWRYFAATITYNHISGRRCSRSLQISLNMCRGEELKMGNDDLNKSGSGRYRANTWWRYPY